MRTLEPLRSRQPFLRRLCSFAVGTALVLAAPPSHAQMVVQGIPSPDAPVHAFAVIGNTMYVGGSFNRIGTFCGGGAPFDATTGRILPGVPAFRSNTDPWWPGGVVTAAVADGAGGWYVGGVFDRIGGVSRPYLAHLDANGVLLPWAAPPTNGPIWSLLLSGSTLYLGGDFTMISGTTRNRLAALDVTTGTVAFWDPGADGRVTALALSGSTLYVGGDFNTLGGQPRVDLGAVDTGTGAATSWAPVVSGAWVNTIALDAGLAYVGGVFSTVQGQPRANAAALNLVTAAVTSWSPDANGAVMSLVPTASSVYAGGEFTNIGGRARTGIAQLNKTNGSASATWNAGCDDYVYELTLSGTTLYAGGAFTVLGGESRLNVGAIDLTTEQATPWAPSVDGSVSEITPSGDAVWLGGRFRRADLVDRRGLAAIDLVTRTVTSWHPDVQGSVRALATDGSTLYVGGTFEQAGGELRNSLAAYALPSATPTAFDAQVNEGSALVPVIYTLSLDAGVLRVGGIIDHLGGQSRSYAGAVDPVTGIATAWAPEPNSVVRAIVPGPAGIYLAGAFNTVQGVSRLVLAQVDPTTGAPTTWTPPVFAGGFKFGGTLVPPNLFSLARKDDVLYVGGSFQTVDGVLRANYCALDPAGELLPWNVSGLYVADANIGTIALDAEGTSVLAASSSFAPTFRVLDPASGASAGWPPIVNGAEAVARAGGYILVGGSFIDAGTVPSPQLAVIIDPAALDVPIATLRPGTLSLSRPVPNPARLESSIRWTVAQRCVVTVRLLDLAGRQVRALVDRREFPAGSHTVTLDAAGLAPGLYLLEAEAGGERVSGKLLIVR